MPSLNGCSAFELKYKHRGKKCNERLLTAASLDYEYNLPKFGFSSVCYTNTKRAIPNFHSRSTLFFVDNFYSSRKSLRVSIQVDGLEWPTLIENYTIRRFAFSMLSYTAEENTNFEFDRPKYAVIYTVMPWEFKFINCRIQVATSLKIYLIYYNDILLDRAHFKSTLSVHTQNSCIINSRSKRYGLHLSSTIFCRLRNAS